MKISQFIEEYAVTMTAKRVERNPNMQSDPKWEAQATHWKVFIKCRLNGGPFVTFFSQGSGHGGKPPELATVLGCLSSDANSVYRTKFSDWCRDLGYSDDSIKAKATYDVCVKQSNTIREWMTPDAFARFIHLEEDE